MYKVLLSAGCDPKDVVWQRLPYKHDIGGLDYPVYCIRHQPNTTFPDFRLEIVENCDLLD